MDGSLREPSEDFDEIITGFRHGLGGYQEICGVTPDLTTLGKSVANGFPMAAICGREDLMNRFNTAGGDVFYLGTFNAHPVSTAASLATIEELEHGSVYEHMFKLGDRIREALQEMYVELDLKTYSTGYGSVFVNHFLEPPVESYTDLLKNNTQTDLSFRRKMVEKGILSNPPYVLATISALETTLTELGRSVQLAIGLAAAQKHIR